MNSSDNSFTNLGRFIEDDFEDTWEQSEKTMDTTKRYTNKELVGTGGMKEIYKVFDTKLNRYTAMAELIPETPEELCEVFLREASVTASLEHPNIISVYDMGVNENQDPYFTMELKVGKSLDSIIKYGQIPRERLLEIFLKICDAISYAHSRNILHLDLKPANIQVGTFGEVQVCDWGLSQSTGSITGDKINGTPGYMAPEQSQSGKPLNEFTDVFSLGAILYSLITGERPLEGGVKTVLDSTSNGNFRSPVERFPEKNIPLSLSAVIDKAMKLSPDQRYASIDELKSEVQKYLTGRSTLAENAGFIKEFFLFFNRNRQVCLVASAALLMIFLGTLVSFVKIQSSQAETQEALTDLKSAHNKLLEAQEQERALFAEKNEALQKYVEADEARKDMFDKLLDRDLRQAYDLMIYPLYYSFPAQSVAKSHKILMTQLKHKRDHEGLMNLMFLNLFVSQKYDQLEPYRASRFEPLFAIAQKYKSVQKNKFGVLDEKDFILLLQDINSLPHKFRELKYETIERSICYMCDVRKPIFTSTETVVELLKCWNPGWDSSDLVYDKQKLTLILKGRSLTKLIATARHSSSLCFLRFLKIDFLDLKGSGLMKLSQLKGLDINRLDIRNTKVKSLHPHNATKGIKEVYLKRGQFNNYDTRHIPQSVKLIYK